MMRLRTLVSGLLALVMSLTSGAMAVARGQAYDVAGQIILCSGHGIMVVHVGADGQPVERPHLCPDCALSALDHGAPPHVPPAVFPVAPIDFVAGAVPRQAIHAIQAADARAPPFSAVTPAL